MTVKGFIVGIISYTVVGPGGEVYERLIPLFLVVSYKLTIDKYGQKYRKKIDGKWDDQGQIRTCMYFSLSPIMRMWVTCRIN